MKKYEKEDYSSIEFKNYYETSISKKKKNLKIYWINLKKF